VLHPVTHTGSVRRGIVLPPLTQPVSPQRLWHSVWAEGFKLRDSELSPRLLHPVSVNGLTMIDSGRLKPEISIKLRYLTSVYRINLRIPERV